MLPFLSGASILAVALWLMLELSLTNGQAQYRLTQLRPGRPMKPPVLKSGPECPFPHFPNGVAKLRQRSKMIRFQCASGFTRVGNMYSMCEKGRWDNPIPICIRPGCSELLEVNNGQISYEEGQAAGMLFCSSGYQVAGSAKTYCNGTHWDRPLGTCRETGIEAGTSCDFEVADFCGWMNEATHDFDWIRSDGVLSPKALKTGPKYDHTTLTPLGGHFMMVDSSVQFTNETARLLSPIYPANYSINTCFYFYYHMFGDSVGTLSVYVKPVSQQLDNMNINDAYFRTSGNKRNLWHEGYFDMRKQSESFQIVIEASLGMKFKSDIAIDDVSLDDKYCRPKPEGDDAVEVSSVVPDDTPPEVPNDDDIFKVESCENRCGKNVTNPVQLDDTNVIHCDCVEGCVDTKTCCPDYAELCVFNDFVGNTTTSTTVPTTSSTTVKTSPKPTTTSTTSTTTLRPTTSTTTSTRPTTTSTTTQKTTTTSTTASTTTKTTPKSTARTTMKTTAKPATTSTTKIYNLRPRTTTIKTAMVPMVRTRKPTTTPPPTTTPQTTAAVTLQIVARFGESLGDELSPPSRLELDDVKPNLGRVFLFSGIGAVAFGCVVLMITLHIRRNSGASVLQRLKQKSMKKHFGSSEGFEDVRFLASDEHLDFSIPEDAHDADESNAERAEEKKDAKKGEKKGGKKAKK